MTAPGRDLGGADMHGDAETALAFNRIAMAHAALKEYALAEAAFDAALLNARRARDPETVATVQLNRADFYLGVDRFDDARACCDQAFELFGRLRATIGSAATHKTYGVLYRQTGKLHLAETHLSLMIELARQADQPVLAADAERERALVYHEQRRHNDALQSLGRACRMLGDLDEELLMVARAWGESIESPGLYTVGHCARVAEYTARLAEAVGMAGRDLSWLRVGAFLHDIGKTRVPECVPHAGQLQEPEWETLRAHTIAGDRMVAGLALPYDLRPVVRSHHERWDGAGFPDGLSGEEIPLAARLLGIADVYDALTTDRSYRSAFTQDEALAIMQAEAGRMIDPHLFDVFKSMIEVRQA